MPRIDASADVLDAAERLFAQHGIATVSDRRIAEEAENSNHSAVRYYFGGREGLLTALTERHHGAVQPLRREMQASAETLVDDVRAMVIPQIRVLAGLGVPSWRARFVATLIADPSSRDLVRTLGHDPVTGATVFEAIARRLAHLDQQVVRRRAQLMGYMVATACASMEEREERGEATSWEWAGWFLSDSIVGMLQAPISEPPPGASPLG